MEPSIQNVSTSESLTKAVVVAVAASAVAFSSGFHTTQDTSPFLKSDFLESVVLDLSGAKKILLDDSVAQKISWLGDFYESSKSAQSAREVLPVISGIKQLFAEKKYSVVSDILLEMEINKLSHTAMVAFISAAYPARDKLDSWSLSVDKVKMALSKDGLDPDDILKGLI